MHVVRLQGYLAHKKVLPLGPYSRAMLRCFLGEVPLYIILECTATTMLRMLPPRRPVSPEAAPSLPMHYRGTSLIRNNAPLGP